MLKDKNVYEVFEDIADGLKKSEEDSKVVKSVDEKLNFLISRLFGIRFFVFKSLEELEKNATLKANDLLLVFNGKDKASFYIIDKIENRPEEIYAPVNDKLMGAFKFQIE